MITPVDKVNFKGRLFGYKTSVPKPRTYRYGEFMPELQDKNPIKEFFNKLVEKYNKYKQK